VLAGRTTQDRSRGCQGKPATQAVLVGLDPCGRSPGLGIPEGGSNAVVADGTRPVLCTYLSAVHLLPLVLNATLRWGGADPLAGLIVAGVATREGIQAWKGQDCRCPTAAAHRHRDL